MGSVASIGRRLAALEAQRGRNGLAHLSDEELAGRIAVLDAELVAGLEAEGVVIPPDLDAMGNRERDEWIAAKVRELEGAIGPTHTLDKARSVASEATLQRLARHAW